jgi:CubicO group peptidase (beta-lactamase class C family)
VTPDRLDRIGALLDEAVGDGDAIAGRPMQADTVFDLASLTKVVATTTVTLALAGRGELGLGDPVAGHAGLFASADDLANAVHAGRDAAPVQALRRAVHAAVTATPP